MSYDEPTFNNETYAHRFTYQFENTMSATLQTEQYKYSYELKHESKLNNSISKVVFMVGNLLLLVPEAVLDLLAYSIDSINGYGVNGQTTITSRIFDIKAQPLRLTLLESYINTLLYHESKYLRGFYDSELLTFEVLDGEETINYETIKEDQKRLAISALKDMYFSKYKLKINDRTKEVYSFYEWDGIDYVTLPVVVGTLLFYRGLDRKISFEQMQLTISLEPINSIIREESLQFLLNFELGIKKFPLKLLYCIGTENGSFETSFIGIGTSIGAAQLTNIYNNYEQTKNKN
jgi:hypothetical protein